MTIQQVQDLIFNISGHKTGCRKNQGSMKPYLTFQIRPVKDQYKERFSREQQVAIKKDLQLPGTFSDDYRIDIKAQYLEEEKRLETVIQGGLF